MGLFSKTFTYQAGPVKLVISADTGGLKQVVASNASASATLTSQQLMDIAAQALDAYLKGLNK